MNENHTKAHLKNIVENMIDELKECEDGTVFATSELLASLGYDVTLEELERAAADLEKLDDGEL